MKKIILLSLIFLGQAYAFECAKNADVETLAKEAIMQELSGVHISELEGSDCLKQENFPQIRLVYDPSTERSQGPEYLVDKTNLDLKITTELRDKENHVYKASYTLGKVKKMGENTLTSISDEIEFYLYVDQANQSKFGCAAVISPPQKRTLFTHCQKKE